MIKSINKDTKILIKKSKAAVLEDVKIGRDLLDTLEDNKEICVGMAANMIGVNKRIIVFKIGDISVLMYNPLIIKKDSPYETTEGCLSLVGERTTTRYKNIEVEFLDKNFEKKKLVFKDFIAQIIQHEVDHCNGILI